MLKKQFIRISSLFLAIILLSCGTYRRYERPESIAANVDSLYRTENYPLDTLSSIASLAWDEFFTDTLLQALIREGIEANSDLNIARLKVEEAKATLLSSKLAFLPSLQFEPEGTLSSFDGSSVSKTYNLAVSASWEIDIFGKLTTAKRGALAAMEQSEAYRQAVQTELIATIADNYYSLLMLDEQVRISAETAESWQAYVRCLHALMRAGRADSNDIHQAEASRLETESSLLALRQQVCELENSLSALLGRVPGRIARSDRYAPTFPDSLTVGMPLNLLSNRPDIREAEGALAQAFYVTQAARAAFYPTITLGGSAGWTNSGGAVISNPGAWLLQAVGSLVQPLFNRGTNIANLRIARAQQEEAIYSFRQALLDAGTEVNNALSGWQSATKRTNLDEQRVEHLTETVRGTALLMEYGDTDFLQVLTARQSLLAARLTLASSRYEATQCVISLYHALGGGAS